MHPLLEIQKISQEKKKPTTTGFAVFVGSAVAQSTVPLPQINLEWDHTDEWDRVYPAGSLGLEAQPYIIGYRVEITRVGEKTPTSTVTVLRQNVVRNQGILRANGVVVPIGSLTIVMKAMSAEGRVSTESNSVPFVSTGPIPSAPRTLRVSPVP